MPNKIKIEEDKFPSGALFKRVKLDDRVLGSYEVKEAGFLPSGKRKPRPTEFEAVLDIIVDEIRKVAKQIDSLEAARSELFERQNEFK